MTTDFDVAFAIVSVGANAIQDPVMFAAIFRAWRLARPIEVILDVRRC
jgi:hypothetical protein